MRVWTVEDEAGWAAIQGPWEALFARDPGHAPFLSWAWMAPWRAHFGRERALKVVCVGEVPGVPALIAPFQAARRRLLGGAGVRDWLLLGAESVACSDHLGFLGAAGAGPEAVGLALDRLWDEAGWADRLCLTDLPAEAPLAAQVAAWGRGRGLHLVEGQGPVCPVAELAPTYEAFLASLSANFRAQIGRSCRKVEGDPTLAEARVTDPEEARRCIRDLVVLNRVRLATKGVDSSLGDPVMAAFLEDMAAAAVAADLGWLDVIRAGDRLVAAALHLVHGPSVAYYQGGFDPAYAAYRPATVLFARVIARAIGAGLRHLDFLRGDEAYKYRWGARAVAGRTVAVMAPAVSVRMLHGLAGARSRVGRAVRGLAAGRAGAAAAGAER